MTKTEVLEHYGGVVKAASSLGITKGAVSSWPEDLPLRTQCFVQVATKGRLKVDKSLLSDVAAS